MKTFFTARFKLIGRHSLQPSGQGWNVRRHSLYICPGRPGATRPCDCRSQRILKKRRGYGIYTVPFFGTFMRNREISFDYQVWRAVSIRKRRLQGGRDQSIIGFFCVTFGQETSYFLPQYRANKANLLYWILPPLIIAHSEDRLHIWA